MNNIEALDVVFSFFPKTLLERLKKEGLYTPILARKIKNGSQLYEHLSEEHSAIQDSDYSVLADDIAPYLKKGSVLQIGCGRGDLLFRLSEFDFAPIYGVDSGDVMLAKARERLADKEAYFFNSKIEEFDLSMIGETDNVVMNNFWGMIGEKASIDLLNRLKKVLSAEGVIIIGEYISGIKSDERKKADKTLRDNLDFTFSYPFFNDFSSCGYKHKIVKLDNRDYYILHL
jgi:SAM-dependent methyltransferase